MRNIDLTPYNVVGGDGKTTQTYSIKDSLEFLMFHADLLLNFKDLLEHDRINQKIQKADGSVLLEDADYARVKLSIESMKGFTKNDVDFVKRILESPEVEVEVKS